MYKTQITTLPGCVKRGKYDIKDDKKFNFKNSESYIYKMEHDFNSNVHFGPLTKEEEEKNKFPIEQRYRGSYQRGVKDNDIFNLKMNKENKYNYSLYIFYKNFSYIFRIEIERNIISYGNDYSNENIDEERINYKGKKMFRNNNTFKSQIEFM